MRVWLVAVLLLAGCSSPPAPAAETPFAGDVEERVEEDVEGANGTGAVRGTVRNGAGAVLADVHVFVVGHPHVTRSGPQGEFEVLDVPAGLQRLRFDRTGYVSLERDISVVEGKVTRLNVTLANDVVGGPGFVEHLHDRWRGSTEITIFDGVVRHQHTYAPAGTNLAPCARWGTAAISGGACYDIPIVPDEGSIIPPGTDRLTFVASWEDTQFVPTVSFYYQAANATEYRATAAMASGESVEVPVRHPMPDHGHQANTQWSILLHAEPNVGGVSFSSQHLNEQTAGDFSVRVVAHRGSELPAEEPHPRYWAAGGRVTVLEVERTLQGLPRDRIPTATVCSNSAACFLPVDSVVPAGTTRLLVTLEYEAGTQPLEPHLSRKTLAFRTAALPPLHATLDTLRVDPPIEAVAGRTVYELSLEEGEADPFYQTRSNWMFLLANEGDERGQKFVEDCVHFIAGCGGTTYTLKVEAVNDNWTPELAGIRD